MAAVAEGQRIAELRRLGASAPLIRLSSGECVHDLFRDCCVGPPYFVYHGTGTPDGPPLVPLWDHCDTVAGLWERPDGLQFVEFDIETHAEYRLVARTEQGFWVTRFDSLWQCEASLEDLRTAADAVGFRFLDRLLGSLDAAEGRLGTFEGHEAWLAQLVADVDRACGRSD